jgi:hypothetical protein
MKARVKGSRRILSGLAQYAVSDPAIVLQQCPDRLATATSEGDPVVAIGGAVPVSQRLRHVHQTMDTVNLFRPVTKFSAEIDSGAAVSEVLAMTRWSMIPRCGTMDLNATLSTLTSCLRISIRTTNQPLNLQVVSRPPTSSAHVEWTADLRGWVALGHCRKSGASE